MRKQSWAPVALGSGAAFRLLSIALLISLTGTIHLASVNTASTRAVSDVLADGGFDFRADPAFSFAFSRLRSPNISSQGERRARILNVAAVPFPRDGDESPELLAVLHGRLASSRNVLILAVGTGGQRRNSSNCLLAHVHTLEQERRTGTCKVQPTGEYHKKPHDILIVNCTLDDDVSAWETVEHSRESYSLSLQCGSITVAVPRTEPVLCADQSADGDSAATARSVSIAVPPFFGAINCLNLRSWLNYYIKRFGVKQILLYLLEGDIPCRELLQQYPEVAVHIFPPAKTMGYSMHYNGQLLAVHDAWLRSLHSTEWFGSLDLDEYLVVPPDAHDLGMYLGHVRESTGKIGVTFGMQYYDWTYGDLEAAAAEPTEFPPHYLPDLAVKPCGAAPFCNNPRAGDTPDLCLQHRGRRKYFSMPRYILYYNVHFGSPDASFHNVNASVAKLHQFRGVTTATSGAKVATHCR